MSTRRTLLTVAASSLLLAACATSPRGMAPPPIIFVHGNGDSASIWQTMVWRFESNGWPSERLHAIDLPYPLARDEDGKPQPGRTSTAEHMAYLKSEVEKVLKTTGAKQVVLVGNSRGGYAIRNYIQNGGGDKTVSHAVLGGTPNHGVWAVKGFREANEFSGTGPFLTALNAPKNVAGDEVTGPVMWMTIRSDNNDKFAQPDGLWIGAKGTPTNVSSDGPALKGANNVVLPRVDHRETSFSPAAFEATYRFITGKDAATSLVQPRTPIVLNGKITGLGLVPTDPSTGNFSNNLPLAGAQLAVYATQPSTGERLGEAVHNKTVGADGQWGPFTAQAGVPYEFVVSALGYATTHIYRSPFPRSSDLIHLRAERPAQADKDAKATVTLTRPRGYFDASRDTMSFDGKALTGVPPTGAGVSSAKLNLAQEGVRPITAVFNEEKITGRTWPAADNRVVVLELTY
ncbi:pimeloyl-ACP methyl ester carboxylesterase [Hydrogenophaga palleronii]|uniref:Pimeloyl-ACP methyl ester carboxylesterase n=1 Tax=Hydrogenophaga palleronii TaxID=65655 RepID=A0ABU1WMA9_9BURK|nr:alpha/beta fold hydrolase [Hydrogenophaga palleronii]MDR7150431.1 pimeloyl-ACP methyl ester carboxylesterase [Hydrogenophaga palleronii]